METFEDDNKPTFRLFFKQQLQIGNIRSHDKFKYWKISTRLIFDENYVKCPLMNKINARHLA